MEKDEHIMRGKMFQVCKCDRGVHYLVPHGHQLNQSPLELELHKRSR